MAGRRNYAELVGGLGLDIIAKACRLKSGEQGLQY